MKRIYATSQDKGRAYKAIHEALKAEVYPEPVAPKTERHRFDSKHYKQTGDTGWMLP